MEISDFLIGSNILHNEYFISGISVNTEGAKSLK